MHTGKDGNFFSRKIRVRIVRERRKDGSDLSPNTLMIGNLSDGDYFTLAPTLNKPLCLVGDDPRILAFKTGHPVEMIMLFQNGWIIVTGSGEEYMIQIEEGRNSQ